MAIPGGAYPADQNEDGTWNIRGVPIFSECDFPLPKGGTFTFDRPWLEGAIQAAAAKEGESFLARVHIHHHDDGTPEVADAGYLRPTHVQDLTLDGTSKATLYADLLDVPAEVYEMVKAGRLPYRSIEAVPQEGFVDSLALMPTKAPFHRLPMLSIGEERPAPQPAVVDAPEGSGALVASFSRGPAFAALSHFGEHMAKSDTPEKDVVKAEADDSAPFEKKESKDEGQASEGDGADKGGGGWKSDLDALKSCDISVEEIPDVVAAIREFADGLESSAAPESDTPEPEEEVPVMPEEGPVEMSDPKTIAIEARAEAALARGEVRAMKSERDLEAAVDAAAAKLTRYNITREELSVEAKSGGQDGLDIFVRAVKRFGQKAPPTSGFDFDAEDTPPEVAKFADARQQRVAFDAAQQYDALPSSAHRNGLTKERFIELRVQSATEGKEGS